MNKLLLLTIGALSSGAIARADGPVVAPLTIPEVAADASAVWAGVTGGQMSAAQAWKDGLLDAATVQAGLAKGVASGQSEAAMQLRRELGGLLIHNAPDVAAAGETLPAGVQLALADAYADAGDEGAAPLYEAVIAQTTAPYEKGLRLLALGKFWSNQKQPQKAQEVFARGHQVLLADGRHAHFAAEMLLNTARAWSQAGDEAKAREFYDKTVADGDSWMSGLALYDQAYQLIAQGQHETARQLLMTPVKGQNSEQIQIVLENLLSLSYYKTGEMELAKKHSQNALQIASVITIPQGKGLEATINSAQAIQNWIAQWEKAPISIANKNFRIVLVPQKSNEATVSHHVFVRTPRDVPLLATVDDQRAQVHDVDNKRENEFFVQKELVLEVQNSLRKSVDITLTVSSPQFPNYQARIPFHVEVPKQIQISSSSVFFGEVKANEPVTRKLTLSAAVPFRILDVKTDTVALAVRSPEPQAAKEQTITLILTSPQMGRFYNGTLLIQTDVSEEEVINIPCIALFN